MAHQPFNNWLLGETELTHEQNLRLKTHLETCDECRQIQSAWYAVKTEIQNSPAKSPATGFSLRWKANLKTRTALNQKQLAQRWFLGLSAGAFVTLALLAIQTFTSGSAWSVLAQIDQFSSRAGNFFTQLKNIAWLVFHNASPIVWIVLGVGIASWIAISILAGSFIILRAKNKEAVPNEN
jgi:hypothetical protein